MKGSDYLIILILVIGLGVLGFLFTQQDKTPQEIFSDISGKVTGSSTSESSISNSAPQETTSNQTPTDTHTPPVTNPPATTTSTNQNPLTQTSLASQQSLSLTNMQEDSGLGISILLPEGTQLFPSTEVSIFGVSSMKSAILLKGDEALTVEKFITQEDFDKILSITTTDKKDYPPDTDAIVFAPETLSIDGKIATRYGFSIGGVVGDVYQVVVPSERFIASFALESLGGYSLKEVMEIISTIKFK